MCFIITFDNFDIDFNLIIAIHCDFPIEAFCEFKKVTHYRAKRDIAILNKLWCKIPAKFSGFQNKLMEKFHKLMLD
ncbi:hypothetical protein BGP_1017 [Beggiatoa sp. PS]|nr:hypothetical protein BGP_1017 [Beggiatoa sp. PS]